ncbi:MAG: hypothetical protein ACFCD0_16270 [Gemmataceae bacterium]
MNHHRWMPWMGLVLCVVASPAVSADEGLSFDAQAAKRGHESLTKRALIPALWSQSAYDNAWKYWTPKPKSKPKNYDRAFMEYYGLHPTPYPNGGFPMGLRQGKGFLSKGVSSDCMLCHGGSINGKSYIGLPNTTLDIEALHLDMGAGTTGFRHLTFTHGNVRGTSEAVGFGIYLLGIRDPKTLKLKLSSLTLDPKRSELKVPDQMCGDPPAWWLLKKKKTMYHTGSTPAASVRTNMQFMLGSSYAYRQFEKEEGTFRDIREYFMSLEPPRYPWKIDQKLAEKGRVVFEDNCSKCHGTYGKDWTYPNRVIPMRVIQTDPLRFTGLHKEWGDYYNKSWFAQKEAKSGKAYPALKPRGYQAPPLDGVWATAPYLHNGSVPTIYAMLNSKARPKIFTRSYRTDASAYDKKNLGWKVRTLRQVPNGLSNREKRHIYDTRIEGRGNQGHYFGDDLTEPERLSVVEYLKTL